MIIIYSFVILLTLLFVLLLLLPAKSGLLADAAVPDFAPTSNVFLLLLLVTIHIFSSMLNAVGI